MKRPGRKGLTLGALLAVVGPGLLAGLSDDDPAGITTYSVLGADHGYQLLWVLLLSTVALVLFHGLAARMGVVTGQGLIGLVRQRYGVRLGGAVLVALVAAMDDEAPGLHGSALFLRQRDPILLFELLNAERA